MGDEKRTTQDEAIDDTEGHRLYAKSDATVKSGVRELADEDDVEGHKAYARSDATVKSGVGELPDDDTKGHALRSGR